MKAYIGKEIHWTTPNKAGTCGQVTAAMAEFGVNLYAFTAWEDTKTNMGHFMCFTDNNAKALEALRGMGYKPTENDVCCVEMNNKPGAMAECCTKIGNAGLNITYTYCTANKGTNTTLCMVCTNDNQKTVKLFG